MDDTMTERIPADHEASLSDILHELQRLCEIVAKPSLENRLTLDAEELAQALGVSERSVWSWTSVGDLPPPVKLGGRKLWRVEAVKKALEDREGCE
jgi:predicted DNA-binding transcriptional regulator AlpA